jgi:hypothetical protein
MEKDVTCKSYNLRKEDGQWLGQILVSSDGMIAGVTDWGNFAYSWRSFGDSIEDFILRIDSSYFGGKLGYANAYIQRPSKDAELKNYKLAEMILPALKLAISAERNH